MGMVHLATLYVLQYLRLGQKSVCSLKSTQAMPYCCTIDVSAQRVLGVWATRVWDRGIFYIFTTGDSACSVCENMKHSFRHLSEMPTAHDTAYAVHSSR